MWHLLCAPDAVRPVRLYRRNGGCWFLSTHSCFTGWPFHPVSPAVRLYYNAELAWYCHLLLKPVLRYGMPDGAAMLVHHCCTLALVLLSYGLGFVRIGVAAAPNSTPHTPLPWTTPFVSPPPAPSPCATSSLGPSPMEDPPGGEGGISGRRPVMLLRVVCPARHPRLPSRVFPSASLAGKPM